MEEVIGNRVIDAIDQMAGSVGRLAQAAEAGAVAMRKFAASLPKRIRTRTVIIRPELRRVSKKDRRLRMEGWVRPKRCGHCRHYTRQVAVTPKIRQCTACGWFKEAESGHGWTVNRMGRPKLKRGHA